MTFGYAQVPFRDLHAEQKRAEHLRKFVPHIVGFLGRHCADYRVVIVKSAQHFYNGFVGVAKEILYVATPGAADPDVTRWPYTKRKTPFWPKVADPWKG